MLLQPGLLRTACLPGRRDPRARLDSAEDAVVAARRNAERNGLPAEFVGANVFDWFNAPVRATEPLWDVIVLDPPPFAKSKSALAGALRGTRKSISGRCSGWPRRILATYTCSHHMQDAELRGVLAEAAADPSAACMCSNGATSRRTIRCSRRCRKANISAGTSCGWNKFPPRCGNLIAGLHRKRRREACRHGPAYLGTHC